MELSESLVLMVLTVFSLSWSTNGMNLTCYYNNIAYTFNPYYISPVLPSNLNSTLCTHYVYAYAILNKTNFEITSSDPTNDIIKGGYLNFTRLRASHRQAKFLLALGGAADSNATNSKYSKLVSNTANINAMVNSVVKFLKRYQFDGLSFDWLFPNSPSDYVGYNNVIIALKAAFQPNRLLLTSSVSPFKKHIDGYSVCVLNRYLDLVYLTTFGYHTPDTEPYYGRHPSPLFSPPNDPPAANLTVDFSVQYWLKKGLSPWLVNMGIPLHGYIWKMNWTIYMYEKKPYPPPVETTGGLTYFGTLIGTSLLSYRDVCVLIARATIDGIAPDMQTNIGSYFIARAKTTPLWGGYDSGVMVAAKFSYAVKHNLGGLMLFDISQDDVQMECSQNPFPITNLVSAMLSSLHGVTPKPVSIVTTPRTVSNLKSTTAVRSVPTSKSILPSTLPESD